MTKLPGNTYSVQASHFATRAHEEVKLSEFQEAEAFASIAQVFATLAGAYETRTATLATLQASNHSAAVRGYGAKLEDAPDDLMEFLSEKAEEIADRLGKSE